MAKYKKPHSHKGLAIAVVLLTVFTAAGGGLGVVWLRQQITRSAQNSQLLEQELADLNRRNSFVATKISRTHHPEYLLGRVGNRLQPTREHQIVRATLTPQRMMPERERRPFEVSVDLAFIDTRGIGISE